jgi:hypothetical protein
MRINTKIIKIFLVIIVTVFLNSCNNGSRLVEPGEGIDDFGIYFLKDTTIKIDQLFYADLTSLELAATPWIGSKDIDFYDWSSHCIYLKKDKSYLFPNYKTPYTIPQSWLNRPYVVVADRAPCYIGYFKSDDIVPTSYYADHPYITSNEINNYPDDVLATKYYQPGVSAIDFRLQSSVRTALLKLGILRGGIIVTFLTDSLKVTNSDTASIKYTVTFTNNGSDNLFLFDPYKTENNYYNYYNQGPVLRVLYYSTLYSSDNRIKQKPNSWNSGWYTLLKSGEVLTRTMTLKGYPKLPLTEYVLNMQYQTPAKEVTKEIRTNAIGRYWIGPTTSINTFNIVVKK